MLAKLKSNVGTWLIGGFLRDVVGCGKILCRCGFRTLGGEGCELFSCSKEHKKSGERFPVVLTDHGELNGVVAMFGELVRVQFRVLFKRGYDFHGCGPCLA